MANTTTVVFVPGSFATPGFYEPVVAKLKEDGIEATIAALQSVGKKEKPVTATDDAKHIQSVVKPILDGGKDVLLVAHSYGGVPSTMSIEGLSKAAREKDGKKNGIVGILYAAAVVPPVGTNTVDFLQMPLENPMMIRDDEHWAHLDLDIAGFANFDNVDPATAKELSKHFGTHCISTFMEPVAYGGFKDVPVSWIFSLKDMVVSVEIQQKAIDHIEKETGNKVQVYKLDCGHGIFIPDTKPATEVIKKVLGV